MIPSPTPFPPAAVAIAFVLFVTATIFFVASLLSSENSETCKNSLMYDGAQVRIKGTGQTGVVLSSWAKRHRCDHYVYNGFDTIWLPDHVLELVK